MRDPLLAPLAAIATGILISRFVSFELRELVIGIAALFILGLLGFWRNKRVVAAACCLLALVFAGALIDLAHRPGPAPELDAEGRAPVLVSGCVVQPPIFSVDREQFVLELEPGARMRVSLHVREGELPPQFDYGQKVELEARVRHPHNFGNPGAFNYRGYLARQDIYWTGSGAASAIQILSGQCGSPFERFIFRLRSAALDRIERLYAGNPYNIGMMQAILIGETAKMERVWTDQFRSTGTFHALVISGTHVAVLAAFLLFLLRICLVPQSSALFMTVLISWLYALVTGWQPPVVRSAAGFSLFVVARYFFRQPRIMNLLAAIALGFLVLDPEQMFEASFQLSFLSVGFIAAFAVPLLEKTFGPLAHSLSDLSDRGRDPHLQPRVAQFRVEMRLLAETVRLWTRLPERFASLVVTIPARVFFYVLELVAISTVVQIGLALPMAVYFHRVSFTGLSANVIVVPLMSLVVPVGFVAVFTNWSVAAKLAGWLLALSQHAVNWHARWEPNWRVPPPPLWLGACFAAALIVAAFTVHTRKLWRIPTIGCVLVLLAILLWHPFPPAIERGVLEMTAIDVGQGDSILVVFPEGKLMIVDGGGFPSFGGRKRSQLDMGEDVVSPYLWSRSIRRVDVVALTHAHEDHIGGLGALLENFHVQELWTGATPDSPQWNSLRDRALRNGVRIVPLRRAPAFPFGGAQVEVLAPSPSYEPAMTPKNNDSLALRLMFGRHSFLLSGDMERPIEDELVFGNLVQKTDVLKVAHHGSKTSSSPELLEALKPTFAIISAGAENSYGHPNPAVLERLHQSHAEVLRTDLWGLVSVRSDGRRFQVDTNYWARWGPSLYSVF